jgi:hypothetical protein
MHIENKLATAVKFFSWVKLSITFHKKFLLCHPGAVCTESSSFHNEISPKLFKSYIRKLMHMPVYLIPCYLGKGTSSSSIPASKSDLMMALAALFFQFKWRAMVDLSRET